MGQTLRKYLKDQYGIMLLDMPLNSYEPGDLVKAHRFFKWGDTWYEISLQQKMGDMFSLLNIPKLRFSARQPTIVTVNDITDSFEIDANAGIPQLGLTASTSIQSGVTVVWTFQSIETVVVDGADLVQFQQLQQRLRGTQNLPNWVSDCFVLQQLFYTTGISGEVHTKGTATGKATFQKANVQATGGFTLTWDDDDTFKLVAPNDVPFGAWAAPAT